MTMNTATGGRTTRLRMVNTIAQTSSFTGKPKQANLDRMEDNRW